MRRKENGEPDFDEEILVIECELYKLGLRK